MARAYGGSAGLAVTVIAGALLLADSFRETRGTPEILTCSRCVDGRMGACMARGGSQTIRFKCRTKYRQPPPPLKADRAIAAITIAVRGVVSPEREWTIVECNTWR